MNKFLVSALLLSAVLANTTITKSSFCNCSQFALQTDCTSSALQCTWNNGCSDAACNTLSNSTCIQIPRCMLGSNGCVSFTSCSQLAGTSAATCSAQSLQCTWTSGANCTNVTAPNCANVPQTSCGVTQFIAADGVCYVNSSGSCAQLPNCGTLTSPTACTPTTTANACMWNATATPAACVANSCAAQQTQPLCMSFPTLTTNLNTIQLCTWGTNCTNGDTGNLTSSNCLTNTYGTYRWSSNNSTDGSCQQCQSTGMLPAILFGLLVLLA